MATLWRSFVPSLSPAHGDRMFVNLEVEIRLTTEVHGYFTRTTSAQVPATNFADYPLDFYSWPMASDFDWASWGWTGDGLDFRGLRSRSFPSSPPLSAAILSVKKHPLSNRVLMKAPSFSAPGLHANDKHGPFVYSSLFSRISVSSLNLSRPTDGPQKRLCILLHC